MTIDKRAIGSSSKTHQIGTGWDDGQESFAFLLGVHNRGPAGHEPTVSVADDINGDFIATFSGGAVKLFDRSGTVSENFTLRCPNLDVIIVDVDKQ